MKKNISIQVRASQEDRDKYKAAAEAMDTTMAEVARDAWKRLVKRADRRRNPKGAG